MDASPRLEHPLPVSGAVRFFDRHGSVFPRVKLAAPCFHLDGVCASFCGFMSSESKFAKAIRRQLTRVLVLLEPHMNLSDDRLEIVATVDGRSHRKTEELESFSATLNSHPLVIHREKAAIRIVWKVQQEPSVSWRSFEPRLEWKDESILREKWDSRNEAVADDREHKLLASLVTSDSVQSITYVQGRSPWGGRFRHLSTFDWAWLGFVVFNPQTSRKSALQRLSVKIDDMSGDKLNAIASMAQGNNLLRWHPSRPTDEHTLSTAYHTTRLPQGTIVFAEPNTDAAIVLQVESDMIDVDVSVASTDRASWGSWVGVVLPEHGLCWILASAMEDVTAHPPSASCLRALVIEMTLAQDAKSSALRLASIVGSRLQFLDVSSCGTLDADDVDVLMTGCPMLRSLSITHDGSYWAAPKSVSSVAALPRLEQLQLKVSYTADYTAPLREAVDIGTLDYARLRGPELIAPSEQEMKNGTLRNLSVLRVSGGDMERIRPALLAFLRHCTRLRYVHCGGHPPLTHNSPLEPGAFKRDASASWELLGSHLTASGVRQTADIELDISSCVAFLSAMHQWSDRWPALARQEIVQVVFSFASSPRRPR
ncbi:hypothetical protein ATCC90586_010843 [Pythium insidiosum]|nr:hypothetical protein ATCC90586_010843 [Pythium insidiosum]